MRAIRSSMNEAELDAHLLSKNLNANLHTVIDKTAERLGYTAEQFYRVMPEELVESMGPALAKAVESGSPDEVSRVFSTAHRMYKQHVDDLLETTFKVAYEEAVESMAVDGPNGFLRMWGETHSHEFTRWEAHFKSISDEIPRIRAIEDDALHDSWDAYQKWYRQRMKGMVDGAKKHGIPIGDDITGAVERRFAAIQEFHTTKRRLFKAHFEKQFDSVEARLADWDRIQDQLDTMYQALTDTEIRAMKQVDDAVAALVPDELGEVYGAWRNQVRELRKAYMVDLREHYRYARNLTAEQRAMYFDEVVTPARMELTRQIYEAEKRGLAALAGNEEALASFGVDVERTRAHQGPNTGADSRATVHSS